MLERFKAWYAFLGGAFAWTLHLLGAYGLSEMICVKFGNNSVLAWALGTLTFVSLCVAGSAMWLARRQQLEAFADLNNATEAFAFMSRTGLISNALFTAVIFAQTLPIVMVRGDCS